MNCAKTIQDRPGQPAYEMCGVKRRFQRCKAKINKLSLNLKKTKYILFKSRKLYVSIKDYNVKIDDFIIEQVDNTKFLGVVINSTLSWQDHLKIVCNEVSKNIGIIFRIKKKSS